MIRSISPEVFDIICNGTQEQRTFLCELEPAYFALYYFSEFFTYKIPDFHFDFYEDIRLLVANELDEAAWIAFRESAKTSIAKTALVCWCICYKKKRFINYSSEDKDNAEAALFDIVVALQTNRKIIEDFGQLYHMKKAKEAQSEAKRKRVANFITENDIQVTAYSTNESVRGRVYKQFRPDLHVLDDIENNKTKDSYALTAKIKSYVNELKSGMAPTGCILYLGNYITDDGVIAHIMDVLSKNPRAVVRRIDVVMNGKPVWPDKYTLTDAQASYENRNLLDPTRRKVSLEAKERSLTPSVYAVEMMNNPEKSGDYFFDRDRIKSFIDVLEAKPRPPAKVVGDFKIWEPYNPSHAYAGGGDTAEGIGGDANASAFIDFTRRPNLVVATFADNQMSDVVFGHELARQGRIFGECLLVPEINNTGYGTVGALVSAEVAYENVWQREVKNKTTQQLQKEYGFRTSTGTKHDILGAFKEAVESGECEILDLDLLYECYNYKKRDLRRLKVEEGQTKHFDKLMAAALAWEGRREARPTSYAPESRAQKFKSKQKPYVA